MSRTVVTRWIVATHVISVVAYVDHGWLVRWLSLSPSRVWQGEVWRLLTWVLIIPTPISLVMSCFVIYKFGGDLADQWGERRFGRYAIEIVAVASLLTCVLSLVTGNPGAHTGGILMMFSLLIAWARQFPDRSVTLYGVVEVRGDKLVALLGGLALLFGLRYGLYAMAPELASCALAAAYPRGWLTR